MIVYVHSTDGETVDSGISIEPREGWTPCVYEPPKTEADEVCVCEGLVRDGESFRAVFKVTKVEVEAMRYSRWGIIKALEKRGLADAFAAYLDATPAAFRRFYGPQFFRADDADFKEMLKTLQGAFKLTDADIAAILAESPYIED